MYPTYGQQFSFSLALVDRSNRPSFKSNPTIAPGDFSISKDGDAFVLLTNTPSSVPTGGVSVEVILTAVEMQANNIVVFARDVSGSEWDDVLINITPLTSSAVVFTSGALTSITSISNLALSHLGHSKEIVNYETDTTQEAKTIRRYFQTALENTLRDYPWPFATKLDDLVLVSTYPNDEWGFSYRYPTDCLRLRRILSGVRNDNRQSRVPYKVGRDDTGLLIFTDQEDAKIEYTYKEFDPQRYPADFVMAFSLRLASFIAPNITGGDVNGMGNRALQLYLHEIDKAKSSATVEEQDEEVPESDFIRSRE